MHLCILAKHKSDYNWVVTSFNHEKKNSLQLLDITYLSCRHLMFSVLYEGKDLIIEFSAGIALRDVSPFLKDVSSWFHNTNISLMSFHFFLFNHFVLLTFKSQRKHLRRCNSVFVLCYFKNTHTVCWSAATIPATN